MTTPSTEVRPPGNDTEVRLLDRALTLFAEKGYEAATVREIIEAAGVTRPVLYYYCSSKEDLFKRLVHWKHDEAYRELANAMKVIQGAEKRLAAIVHGTFAFCAEDPRVPQIMFQTAYGPVIPGVSEFIGKISEIRFSIVQQVMEDGLKKGELIGEAASLALMFCCLMDQHVNLLSRLPNPKNHLTASLADKLVHAFLYGVSGQRNVNS